MSDLSVIVAVGVSHHRAGIGLLERLALTPDGKTQLLDRVRALGFTEAVVLSTCCRTEVYAAGPQLDPTDPAGLLLAALAAQCQVDRDALRRVAYPLLADDVVTHLLRVVSGLDARLLGDTEILGQVRAARRSAEQAGAVGPLLGKLFSLATRTGRLVRRRTELGDAGRTMGRWAVDVGLAALAAHTSAAPRYPVVVGSGLMAQAVLDHLVAQGLHPVCVSRRTPVPPVPPEQASPEQASPAQVGVAQVGLAELVDQVCRADLVVFATSANQPLLTLDMLRDARPEAATAAVAAQVLVDLSLPRNVEPAVASLSGVRLLDLDDLDDDPATRHRLRTAVTAADAIVHEQVADWRLRQQRQALVAHR